MSKKNVQLVLLQNSCSENRDQNIADGIDQVKGGSEAGCSNHSVAGNCSTLSIFASLLMNVTVSGLNPSPDPLPTNPVRWPKSWMWLS